MYDDCFSGVPVAMNTALPPIRHRAPNFWPEVSPWLVASLLLMAAQIVAGLLWPSKVAVTATCLGGQALIIAHHAAFQGAQHRQQRLLWWLLAAAMLLWALAFGAIFILKDWLFADDRRALFDSLLFIARGAPIMLMLTSGIDEEAYGRVWWLDMAQVGVYLGAAALLLLGNPFTGTGSAPEHTAHMLREFQMGALALLALGVAGLHRSRGDARVFRPLAAMLFVYVLVAAVVNHLFIRDWQLPSGSWAFVLGAVPMLVFLLARAFPNRVPEIPFTRMTSGLELLAPTVLPMATLVIVLTPGRRGDVIGETLGIAAVVLYGWRMVSIQLRHRRSIAELTVAHNEATGLSLIDPLTGLGNRRRFDAALMTMLASPGGSPIAVLMIDADWFKAYNDSLGHAAGDAALRQIGAILADLSPVDSAVARLGGEEFAVLARLPGVDAARLLAERLRSAVAALALTHPRQPGGQLTISIGVALTPARDADALMAAADRALYAAKNDGRNCVRSSISEDTA